MPRPSSSSVETPLPVGCPERLGSTRNPSHHQKTRSRPGLLLFHAPTSLMSQWGALYWVLKSSGWNTPLVPGSQMPLGLGVPSSLIRHSHTSRMDGNTSGTSSGRTSPVFNSRPVPLRKPPLPGHGGRGAHAVGSRDVGRRGEGVFINRCVEVEGCSCACLRWTCRSWAGSPALRPADCVLAVRLWSGWKPVVARHSAWMYWNCGTVLPGTAVLPSKGAVIDAPRPMEKLLVLLFLFILLFIVWKAAAM